MKKIFNNIIGEQIWEKKYRFNNESYEEWLKRISNYNPKLQELIEQKKFLFGGRILANIHTPNGSLSNCYSSGYVKDDLIDIMQVNTNLALTYKAQGGQGLSVSKIRPKGAKVGEYFTSDGVIPFMEMYNNTTNTIVQGAGRRGALLISIDITHPEAENVITLKSDLSKMQNTNISMEIDDEFMQAVFMGDESGEEILLSKSFVTKQETIEYVVNVQQLFKLLCEQALKYAEPGIIFTERFRNYNLMEFDDDYQIETCNPCGELPLPPGGACLLGAVNVAAYVKNAFQDEVYFDFDEFIKDIPIYYEELDKLIDVGIDKHALDVQREQALNYRNIGLGTMGWGDLFIKFQCVYGDDKAISLVHDISSCMNQMALYTNCKLGEFKGAFKKFKTPEVYKKSQYYLFTRNTKFRSVVNLPKDYNDVITNFTALRNCSMLTVAPTGSIATMLNISNGIEPIFALEYDRRTVAINGEDTVYRIKSGVVEEYCQLYGDNIPLPDYFIEANNVNAINRIKIQGVLQDHVDSGISSTINLPETTTVEQVHEIFKAAWWQGLKGVTIYVNNSRDNILSTTTNTTTTKDSATIKKRPKELDAELFVTTIKGKKFAILVGKLDNKLYELFGYELLDEKELSKNHYVGKLIKVKKGQYSFVNEYFTLSDLQLAADAIEERATTILVSMLLRHHVEIAQIIKVLRKINPIVSSFTSAICRILNKFENNAINPKELCPKCGAALIHSGGCVQCPSCDYSKCYLIYVS